MVTGQDEKATFFVPAWWPQDVLDRLHQLAEEDGGRVVFETFSSTVEPEAEPAPGV